LYEIFGNKIFAEKIGSATFDLKFKIKTVDNNLMEVYKNSLDAK
jgi:hypothetical protein